MSASEDDSDLEAERERGAGIVEKHLCQLFLQQSA